MNEERIVNWLRRQDKFKSLRLVEDNHDRMVFKAEYHTERPYRITVVSGGQGGLSAHFIPWVEE